MKKLIMLTIFVSCVILVIVGCENGNIKINEFTSGEYMTFSSGEEDLIQSRK